MHGGGRPLVLTVEEDGRLVALLRVGLALRCSDGSTRTANASFGFGSYGWVHPDGSLAHWSLDDLEHGTRQLAELNGHFVGGRVAGRLRVVTIDGPLARGAVTCDSGSLQFAAAWTAPFPRRR